MNKFKELLWIMALILMLIYVVSTLSGCACFRAPNAVVTVPEDPSTEGQRKAVQIASVIVGIALAGIGLGIAATIWYPKFGFPALMGCIGTLAASLSVIKYYQWIALLSVILGLVGVLLVTIYITVVKTKAFKELVIGIQNFRKEELTGTVVDDKLKAGFIKIQSPSTQKLVAETKTDLKLKGVIA